GWNRRAEQIFKTSHAAAMGRLLAELLPLKGTGPGWAGLFTGEEGATARVWSVGDTRGELLFETWTQVHADAAGAPVGATLFGHDATARITAERRAGLESTMLEALKEYLDVVMWAIDRRGTFLYQDG